MTLYGRMDDSIDPNDTTYGIPPLTSSSSDERFANSVAAGSQNFDHSLFYGMTPFDTIEPSSLSRYSHPYPYRLPDNDAFQSQVPQFGHLYPEPFPDIGLEYGLNQDIKPGHHASSQSLIGNQFHAADLGIQPQDPARDDCASVNCSGYCSSDCCTQVCQDDACDGGDVTPCDDLHCFENPSQSLDGMWTLGQGWHPSIQPEANSALHNQPCNHTNTEHDVAITLRDLSAPGASNTHQQYECRFFNGLDHPRESVSSTPDLGSVPPSLEGSLEEHTDAPGTATQFVCQWITPGGPGTQGVCGHVCADSYALHDHLCNDHIAALCSKTKYLCHWKGCSRRSDQDFASRNKLRRHLATHTGYKPHKCETCGESFSAQQALDQHVRTHTGEAPYMCDHEGCGKRFKQKSALTMHKRTHTGEKPLVCEECGKRFCESSNLSKHRKTHQPEYPHTCFCGKKFKRQDQLRKHQETHQRTRARPDKKRKARAMTSSSASVSPDTDTTPRGSVSQDGDLPEDGQRTPTQG